MRKVRQRARLQVKQHLGPFPLFVRPIVPAHDLLVIVGRRQKSLVSLPVHLLGAESRTLQSLTHALAPGIQDPTGHPSSEGLDARNAARSFLLFLWESENAAPSNLSRESIAVNNPCRRVRWPISREAIPRTIAEAGAAPFSATSSKLSLCPP